MACELLCVDPARIHEFWPHVSALIEAAMQRGGISAFAPIKESLITGRALLWIAILHEDGRERPGGGGTKIKAAAVTELGSANGDRFCTIVACGGSDRSDWLPLIAGLENYAKAESCSAVRIFGRRGWLKLLPDYRTSRVLLEKRL